MWRERSASERGPYKIKPEGKERFLAALGPAKPSGMQNQQMMVGVGAHVQITAGRLI